MRKATGRGDEKAGSAGWPTLLWWPLWVGLAAALAVMVHTPAPQPSAAPECAHDPNAVACAAPQDPAAAAAAAPLVGRPRLVEFTSDYCPVCQRMAPLVSQVVGECSAESSVMTVRLEAPEGPALAARYGVAALPAFVTIDENGAELSRRVGKLSDVELRTAVQDVTGAPCEL